MAAHRGGGARPLESKSGKLPGFWVQNQPPSALFRKPEFPLQPLSSDSLKGRSALDSSFGRRRTGPTRGPEKEELQRELAISLYREDMLSFGKARELAEMSKHAFGRLLGERGVERHYGPDELA